MNARPSHATGLAFPFFVFLVFAYIVSIGVQNVCAQWEPIGTFPHQIVTVYFMSEFGHPEIGFVSMFIPDSSVPGTFYARDSLDLWRTSDGGITWKPIPLVSESAGLYFGCRDFTFKDSVNGWMTSYQCYKTTDAGVTWKHLSADVSGEETSIFYHPVTKLLLLSDWAHYWSGFLLDSVYVSADEGDTWGHNIGKEQTGYSFSGLNGVVTGVYPTLYTTDGGASWSESTLSDECWQPACIPGTTTFFAASEKQNRISRSDDGGKTWRTIFVHGPLFDMDRNLSGCIRIDRCGNLYVMTQAEGVLKSSDEGITWHSIGGPSAWGDTRFWITSDYIYAGDGVEGYNSPCQLCPPGTLWRYRLSNPGIAFSDGTKHSNLKAGNDVSMNYSTSLNAIAGADSVHLVMCYDGSLSIKELSILGNWSLLDSSTKGNVLELWLKIVNSAPSQAPSVQFTFKSVLASSSAKIYLGSAHFYGACATCACTLSASGPDSVEIHFDGCGDSTVLQFMSTGSPFQIESVEPNPAGSEVRVHFASAPSVPVEVGVLDVLGKLRLSREVSGQRAALEVSSLPDGVYYLRVSSGGFVETRRVVVGR